MSDELPTISECVHEINTTSVDLLHSDTVKDYEMLIDELMFIRTYVGYAIEQLKRMGVSPTRRRI